MGYSKSHMPSKYENKCHMVIHTATVAAAAAGAIPIPMADAIPITTAQVTMIIALGNVFGVELNEAIARSVLGCGLSTQIGRAVFTNILKLIPGAGHIAGAIVASSTAAAITEALGWLIADDFYRMSTGEKPKDLNAIQGLDKVFNHLEEGRCFPKK